MGCGLNSCSLDEFSCNAIASVIDMDPAHCYQWIAVKTSDTEECDKVQSENWAGTGQNPPKDKCHLMIAEKNTDPLPCDNIEGGMNSYSKDECYQSVGAKGGDADDCDKLSGEAEIECRTGIARGQDSEGNKANCGDGYVWVAGGLGGGSCAVDPNAKTKDEPKPVETTKTPPKTTDEKDDDTTGVNPADTVKPIDPVKPGTKDSPTDAKDADKDADKKDDKKVDDAKDDAQTDAKGDDKQADDKKEPEKTPEEIVKETFEEADKNTPPTPQEEKNSHLSKIIEDIEDQDARSDIIKKFTEEKKKRDDLTIEQQRELLEEIKDQYEFGQAMDEKANTIKANTVDKLTEKVDELVDEKVDEAKTGAWNWIKDKTYGWVKGRDPANKKYVDAAKLAEEKYNKAVEKYSSALDSYKKGKDYFDKAKKAYDEVKQVMDNVRRLQDKVNAGKMTEGQANAIKGGVLLGKGLEYTTKYIPVFGDTISEITAGTFQATMKFAEKRAERTTKLGNCIEDPEHCDPNGISPY